MKLLVNSIMLSGLVAVLAHPGYAAAVGAPFFEGTTGRVVDASTGKDLVVTPGILVLCEIGAAIPCFGVLPDDSDRFVLTAVNNGAGAQIATNFSFCSGPDEALADPGDGSIAGCSDLTATQFNATNHAFRTEGQLVNGVELTTYVPLSGEPGFGASPYLLVSDTPEPATSTLLGMALLAGVGALCVKRLRA